MYFQNLLVFRKSHTPPLTALSESSPFTADSPAVDAEEEGELEPAKELVQPVALKLMTASKAKDEEMPLLFFVAGEVRLQRGGSTVGWGVVQGGWSLVLTRQDPIRRGTTQSFQYGKDDLFLSLSLTHTLTHSLTLSYLLTACVTHSRTHARTAVLLCVAVG